MKKAIALLLAALLCLSLCACGANDKAYDNSKEAFDAVTAAYLATNTFAEDVYEAWYLGVNDQFNYNESSEFADFAAQLHIGQSHLEEAVARLSGSGSFTTSQWAKLPDLYGDSCTSAWVAAVSEAYKCSGKTVEIETQLNSAKSLMKKLGDKHADYQHYPSLKKYFTTTMAFYDFCCHPEGSFEQVTETVNAYRSAARECFFDLNYVFGDSIRGLSAYDTADEDAAEE